MRQHTYYKCPPDCNDPNCRFCRGGLSFCTVCKGAEGSLTTECCGRPITMEEEHRIYYEGILDFKDGEWIHLPKKKLTSKPSD